MRRFLVRRLAHMLVVLLGVSVISFGLVHLSGDPVLLMLPPEATRQQVEEFRHQLGLDRPLYVQYATYLAGLLRGDMGRSLKHQRPAAAVVADFWPNTVALAGLSMLVGLAVAIPTGIRSAVRRRSTFDNVVTALALLGQSLPIFVTGLLLIMLFAVRWRWLPVSGWGTWQQALLPVLTLGIWTAPVLVRLVRSAMLEVLGQDYVRTARAKGLQARVVVYRHAFKNAALPVITVAGIQFGRLLGGAVITEKVFAIPGMGRLTVDAIFNADFPLVQASVLTLAATFVVLNMLVDLLYAFVNPQIRFE